MEVVYRLDPLSHVIAFSLALLDEAAAAYHRLGGPPLTKEGGAR